MMKPKPSLQLTLFQAEKDADRYIQYTMVEQANALSRALSRKGLPMFYFTEAGEELGIKPKTCRSWKINTWPANNWQGDDKLIYRVAIYIRVYLRLSRYPEKETYAEATRRLQQRVIELKEKNFSHNQITQHLRMPFRTLKDILTREPEPVGRRNHCPWDLLERLENAETGIIQQQERQEERRQHRIIRSGVNYNEPELKPEPPPGEDGMETGGRCRKCDAGWHNLRHDGQDAWNRRVMVCIICGNENPVIPEPDEMDLEKPKREEFVERYNACWKCGTPWHNLKRERLDRWENTVYICLRCASANRVKPKTQRARTT